MLGGLAEAPSRLLGHGCKEPALRPETAERGLNVSLQAVGAHRVEHSVQRHRGVSTQALALPLTLARIARRPVANIDKVSRRVFRRKSAKWRPVNEREPVVPVDKGRARIRGCQKGSKDPPAHHRRTGVTRDGRRDADPGSRRRHCSPGRSPGRGRGRGPGRRRGRRRGPARGRGRGSRDARTERSVMSRLGRVPASAKERQSRRHARANAHHSTWYRAGSFPRTRTTMRRSLMCTAAFAAAGRPGPSSSRFSMRL